MFKKCILYYEFLWRKKVICIGKEQISTLYFLSGHIMINNVMYNELLHTFSFHNLKFTWTFTFFSVLYRTLQPLHHKCPRSCYIAISVVLYKHSYSHGRLHWNTIYGRTNAFQCIASLFATYFPKVIKKKKDAFILPLLPDSVPFNLHKTSCL